MNLYPNRATNGPSAEGADLAGSLVGSGPWLLKEFKTQVSFEYDMRDIARMREYVSKYLFSEGR